jgi:hypothetical protein
MHDSSHRLKSLTAVQNQDGRLEVFGIGSDDRIWHTWQTAPSNGWNEGWNILYSDVDRLKNLVAIQNKDGRLELFGTNSQDQIWHTWQTAPNNGWVGRWNILYNESDRLRNLQVVQNQDGRLEVFGTNSQDQIWFTWQTAPNNGWVGRWNILYSESDRLRNLAVTRNHDGRLEVFGTNSQDQIWHTWQTAPNNGWVGRWHMMFQDVDRLRELAAIRNADGRIEVFGVAPDDKIWHTWQTSPSNGWWSEWRRINFAMQAQQQTNWCWAAVSTSVSAFFDNATTWTQCRVVNGELGRTDCCTQGSSTNCNVPWFLDRALTRTGNLRSMTSGSPTMNDVRQDVDNNRPLCVRIGWSGGGGHFVAIDGYNSDLDMVAVDDPWFGASDVALNVLQTAYQGTGSTTHRYRVEP